LSPLYPLPSPRSSILSPLSSLLSHVSSHLSPISSILYPLSSILFPPSYPLPHLISVLSPFSSFPSNERNSCMALIRGCEFLQHGDAVARVPGHLHGGADHPLAGPAGL
jgi:hypothetical protein